MNAFIVMGLAFVSISFCLYALVLGGSSTGVVGKLHRFQKAALSRTIGLVCGKRCTRALHYMDDVCCWRPNPLLQLFYLSLMGGGFVLYWQHSLPLIPNSRLAEWHRISSYLVMSGGVYIFFLASFCDPGTVTAANLHRFSTMPFDNVVGRCARARILS